jgi:hypothetical protein
MLWTAPHINQHTPDLWCTAWTDHYPSLQDSDNPAAAGATGASAADLRVAASKLKSLGPPGTPVGPSFREQLGKPPGQRAAG